MTSDNPNLKTTVKNDDGTFEEDPDTSVEVNGEVPGSGGSTTDTQRTFAEIAVELPETPPIAALDDTESIEIPVRVPDGSTLEVYRWGAYDAADGSSPSGLTVELLDGSDTVQTGASTANAQDKSTPVASLSNNSGSVSVFKLRALNGTGSAINSPGVGCHFGFVVS